MRTSVDQLIISMIQNAQGCVLSALHRHGISSGHPNMPIVMSKTVDEVLAQLLHSSDIPDFAAFVDQILSAVGGICALFDHQPVLDAHLQNWLRDRLEEALGLAPVDSTMVGPPPSERAINVALGAIGAALVRHAGELPQSLDSFMLRETFEQVVARPYDGGFTAATKLDQIMVLLGNTCVRLRSTPIVTFEVLIQLRRELGATLSY